MSKKKPVKNDKKGFLHWLGYIVGAIFVIGGINITSESVGIGFLYILAGVIIIPHTRTIIRDRYDIDLPTWTRIMIFFIILMFTANVSTLIESKQDYDTVNENAGRPQEAIMKDSENNDEVHYAVNSTVSEIEKQRQEMMAFEKRYDEAYKLLGDSFVLRSSKCLAFCKEGEMLDLDDFGVNVSRHKASEIQDICHSYCRKDTEYYITWYRNDINEALSALEEFLS